MTHFPNEDFQELNHIRILSIDGGGIYGYISALMLRRLCERDETFLKGDQVQLFAGTSSGALNALLLARADNPREVVTSGELEQFWHRRSLFDNAVDPVASFLSWFGITAWLGAADFEQALRHTFGDTTFGELKHRVLITAFDWAGVGNSDSRWQPAVFLNFPDNAPHRSCLIRDIAYGAAAPPGFRAVRNGIGDGGLIAPDPAMAAALAAYTYFHVKNLKCVKLLSIGTCTKQGSYWLPNFDMGVPLFNTLPTNPMRNQWFPPMVEVGLDGSIDATTRMAKVFLGCGFHRLAPPLLGPPDAPPTLIATALARFAVWQEWLLAHQRVVAQSHQADDAVTEAYNYLKDQW